MSASCILAVVILVFIILPIIVRLLLHGGNETYHYRAKSHMMTRAEERCFRSLEKRYGAKYYIVSQVH